MKKYILIIVIVTAILSSCKENATTPPSSFIEAHSLNYLIQGYLKDSLGFDSVDVKTYGNNLSLTINIKYSGKYYMDDEPNKIIVSLLIYYNYELLNKYDNVYFILKFEKNMENTFALMYNNDRLKSIYLKSKDSPIFIDFVEHYIKNTSQREVDICNFIIKKDNEYSKLPDFNGSFWMLLYKYSKADKGDSILFKQFDSFYHGTGFEKFKIDQKKYKYFIDKKRGNSK